MNSYVTLVFPVITGLLLLYYYSYYCTASLPAKGTTEWITRAVERHRFSFTFKRHKLERRDIIPMLVLTAVFTFLAFFGLGDSEVPQSYYHFSVPGEAVSIRLSEDVYLGSMYYHTGMYAGNYKLKLSEDGKNYHEQIAEEDGDFVMNQKYSQLYKWLIPDIDESLEKVRFIIIVAEKAPLELNEIALFDRNGDLIPVSEITCFRAPELFDEQELVPELPSYMNSMYFDEIYHGRTANEHIRNIYPYEVSHPPLGKLLISIGIRAFGMTPLGWRFIGALFGVAMLIIMYIFLKNMFGKTVIATCATLVFGFDFMRFVQTRIATIDTYGVIFILLSYFFMYRYITQDYDTRFGRTVPPLLLSGLFFGIGCASKWIVVYAGIGLAVLYAIHQVKRVSYMRRDEQRTGGYLVKTLSLSVVFFIIVPVIIYCLSYIPYGLACGMKLEDGMLLSRRFYKIIWDNQKFMLGYHGKLESTHPYSSEWWSWILDIRPILYYRDTYIEGTKSAFAAFGNPVVWWGGLLAMIAMAVRAVKYRDGKAIFILIGYLSQILPWVVISRIVFIYHYFPSVLFLVMAIAHCMNTIWERKQGRYKAAIYGFTAGAGALFAMFYPVLTGVRVPTWYATNFLRWIPGKWPF